MYAIQKAPFGVYYFATEAQKEQRRKYEMRIHSKERQVAKGLADYNDNLLNFVRNSSKTSLSD